MPHASREKLLLESAGDIGHELLVGFRAPRRLSQALVFNQRLDLERNRLPGVWFFDPYPVSDSARADAANRRTADSGTTLAAVHS